MKEGFKATLFNGHSFKAKQINSYEFNVLVRNLAKILGLASDFDMLFTFNADGRLYLNQKADIQIGEFGAEAKDKITINNVKEIKLGTPGFKVRGLFNIDDNFFDTEIGALFVSVKFNETVKGTSDITLDNMSINAMAINAVSLSHDFSAIDFFTEVGSNNVLIKQRHNIDLNDITLKTTGVYSDVKGYSNIFEDSIYTNVKFKEVSKLGVDIPVNGVNIGGVLLNSLNTSSYIPIGVFDNDVREKIVLNQKQNIDLNDIDFAAGSRIALNDAIDLFTDSIYEDVKFKEILKSGANIPFYGIGISGALINGVEAYTDVPVGVFYSSVDDKITLIQRQEIPMSWIASDINAAYIAIKGLVDITLKQMRINVAFKEASRIGVDARPVEFKFSAMLINGVDGVVFMPIGEFSTESEAHTVIYQRNQFVNEFITDAGALLSLIVRSEISMGNVSIDASYKEILSGTTELTSGRISVEVDSMSSVESFKPEIRVTPVVIEAYASSGAFNSYASVSLPCVKGIYLFGKIELLSLNSINEFETAISSPYSAESLRAETSINAVGMTVEPVIYALTLLRTLDPNTLNDYDNMTIEELERSVILE